MPARRAPKPAATSDGFLNVDLEVGAKTRAAAMPLVDALHAQLFELFRGRLGPLYRAHYEISGCRPHDASSTIQALADVIEHLDASARRAWDTGAMRDFNIGVELARGVRSVELAIEPDVIRRVAALGGRIAFTAYQEAAIPRARLKKAAKTGTRRTKARTPRRKVAQT